MGRRQILAVAVALIPLPLGGRWSLQLGGAYPPAAGVRIVDRDRSDAPARGHYNLCYLNAFQAQTAELRWWRRTHPDLLLTAHGRPVIDTAWNEQLLDTSTPAKRRALGGIEARWIAGCRRSGFQAVDPDNLDSWQRSRGRLTPGDNVAFARLLIRTAHSYGLAIGQKNAVELAPRRLGFDFAVVEECAVYDECGGFTAVYGRRVLEVEYSPRGMARACRAGGTTVERRDPNLLPRDVRGFFEGWC